MNGHGRFFWGERVAKIIVGKALIFSCHCRGRWHGHGFRQQQRHSEGGFRLPKGGAKAPKGGAEALKGGVEPLQSCAEPLRGAAEIPAWAAWALEHFGGGLFLRALRG